MDLVENKKRVKRGFVNHDLIRVQKKNLQNQIAAKVNQICTGDIQTCIIKGCRFYYKCCKTDFLEEGRKLKWLKGRKKLIDKYYYEFKGRKNPLHEQINLLDRCSDLLGENIFEHELIKDSEVAKFRINKATTMNQIVQILDDMHLLKYGKRKSKQRF